jgi:hypothetical protein
MNSKTDFVRLGRDLAALIAECIELKTVLRTTWTRPMKDEQQRLIRVRRKLTERFVLLASLRGKIHVRNVENPTEYHRAIAERLAPEYALASEEVHA